MSSIIPNMSNGFTELKCHKMQIHWTNIYTFPNKISTNNKLKERLLTSSSESPEVEGSANSSATNSAAEEESTEGQAGGCCCWRGLADHASFELGDLGGQGVVGLVGRVGGEMQGHVVRHFFASPEVWRNPKQNFDCQIIFGFSLWQNQNAGKTPDFLDRQTGGDGETWN